MYNIYLEFKLITYLLGVFISMEILTLIIVKNKDLPILQSLLPNSMLESYSNKMNI
jgi:hypothetical protein